MLDATVPSLLSISSISNDMPLSFLIRHLIMTMPIINKATITTVEIIANSNAAF